MSLLNPGTRQELFSAALSVVAVGLEAPHQAAEFVVQAHIVVELAAAGEPSGRPSAAAGSFALAAAVRLLRAAEAA